MVNHSTLTLAELRRFHASSDTVPRRFAVVKYRVDVDDVLTAVTNVNFTPGRPLLISVVERLKTEESPTQLAVYYFRSNARFSYAVAVDGVDLEAINVDLGIRTVVKLVNGL